MYNTNRTSINLFKVGSRNTGKWFEICSKLVIKTPKQHQWHRSDVFIVTFEYISHLFNIFQVFLTPPPLWTGLRASVGKYFFQTESWNLTWRDLIDFDTDHNKTWLNFVLLDDLPGCKTIHIANCSQFFTIFQHILPCSCMKIMIIETCLRMSHSSKEFGGGGGEGDWKKTILYHFWQFSPPSFCKWSPHGLKFSEKLLLNGIYMIWNIFMIIVNILHFWHFLKKAISGFSCQISLVKIMP